MILCLTTFFFNLKESTSWHWFDVCLSLENVPFGFADTFLVEEVSRFSSYTASFPPLQISIDFGAI
jgi:hypothetical protein